MALVPLAHVQTETPEALPLTMRLAGQRRCRRWHPVANHEPGRATIVVTNPSLKSAILLDNNGMKVRTVPATRKGAAFTVKLPPNAMYFVFQ